MSVLRLFLLFPAALDALARALALHGLASDLAPDHLAVDIRENDGQHRRQRTPEKAVGEDAALRRPGQARLLKRQGQEAPELFGGVMQPPAKTEMITLEIEGEASFLQDQPYLYMTVTQGDGLLNGHYIRERDHFILPCGFGTAYMQGSLTLLVSARVPLAIRNNCGDSCSEH